MNFGLDIFIGGIIFTFLIGFLIGWFCRLQIHNCNEELEYQKFKGDKR